MQGPVEPTVVWQASSCGTKDNGAAPFYQVGRLSITGRQAVSGTVF